MPYNLFGEWIESKEKAPSMGKPITGSVKVRLVKRGNNKVTLILNLPHSLQEKRTLASEIKREFGCGGVASEEEIEIQGDKVAAIKAFLVEKGIKATSC